jgi:undecaprenyl-diphosphatase
VEWWQSLILGIVEGLTEYLPVSSTGHLILASHWLGIENKDSLKAFEVVIQAGAILAVVGVYANAIQKMLAGLLGRNPQGKRLALRLGLAFLITAAIAVPLSRIIKVFLFDTRVVAAALIAGGFFIFFVEGWRKRIRPSGVLSGLTWKAAAFIGLMQSVALVPGVSRSLMTLAAGLLVGLSLPAALEFSFLLGGLTLTAAAIHDGWKEGHAILSENSPFVISLGLLAAATAAFITVRWMLRSLEKFGLVPFGYYRIALGLFVLTLLAIGGL